MKKNIYIAPSIKVREFEMMEDISLNTGSDMDDSDQLSKRRFSFDDDDYDEDDTLW